MRQREDKLEEQRLAQEERLKKAQERAQADPTKRVRVCEHQRCALIDFGWLLNKPQLQLFEHEYTD